uniref:Uncharacterized protein n=1 Tax=viral metagenome TaxID=1070528 RepID=A0A6H1ZPS9_9ZZZZ
MKNILKLCMEFFGKFMSSIPEEDRIGFIESIILTKANYFNEQGKLRCLAFNGFEPVGERLKQEIGISSDRFVLVEPKYYCRWVSQRGKEYIFAFSKEVHMPLNTRVRIVKIWKMLNLALWVFGLPIVEHYPADYELMETKNEDTKKFEG